MHTLLSLKQIKLKSIKEKSNEELILPKQVMKLNHENKLCVKIYKYLANSKDQKQPDTFFKDLKIDN